MITVKQILKHKGGNYFFISPGTKVFDALRIMSEKNVGALLVIDADKIVGIFSERDYARRSFTHQQLVREQIVDVSMTTPVITVSSDKTIYDCMSMMNDKHIRHLPVLEGEKIIGVVSIGDIVNAIIFEQNSKIKSLESYITGGGYGAE